jgi:hypothetical protein
VNLAHVDSPSTLTELNEKSALQPDIQTQNTGGSRKHSGIEKHGFGFRILTWFFGNEDRAPRWTVGSQQFFPVGDISATGFYLLTHERWTPGTMVSMNLERKNPSEQCSSDSLSVLAQVVRHDTHGMGLQFVMESFVQANIGLSSPGEGTKKESLNKFPNELIFQHGKDYACGVQPG